MGIKFLNKYIRTYCANSIKKIHFGELQWKKIAVDVSIYLYKFKSDQTLMEQMYLMINLFRFYNIIPIFVFDGKPPDEKRELIQQRKELRKEAKINYELLKEQYDIAETEEEKNELFDKMENEKKKSIRITHTDIQNVKELMDALGVTYCEAPGEADQLCAYLTHKKLVYGCLSEDMDMFVYGCNRVFRYLSLFNRTCIYYNLSDILKSLDLTFDEFKMICIISGTDYNIESNNDTTIYEIIKFYNKYKKQKISESFVEWLKTNNKINDDDSYDNIKDLFDIQNSDNSDSIQKINIKNLSIKKDDVENCMKKYNFIFV
jgi:flap endonuclease-1